MEGLSVSEAIGSGFGVIRRAPWSVVAWAVAMLVVTIPQLFLVGSAAPDLIGLYQRASTHAGGPPDPVPMFALQQKMAGLQVVVMVTSIVEIVVLTGAIFRAVLEPSARRWAYLRLGVQELWLGLAGGVFYILMMLMILVAAFAIGVGYAFANMASAGSRSGGGLPFVIVVGATIVAALWVLLRLSLAPVMSFAERRFVFFESWALTRGKVLKIFLIWLALMVIVWLIELVLMAVFGLGLFGALGFDIRSLAAEPPAEAFRRLVPLFIVLGPIVLLAGTAMQAVLIAPQADIYRQLSAQPTTR